MKTINSISGGQTSSYIAVHYPADLNIFSCVCIDEPECAPKDAAIKAYATEKLSSYTRQYGDFIASAESDETLRALMDLEQLIGKEIVWTRGVSFDDLIDYKSTFGGENTRLPSWARRYCTTEMKILPIFYYWMRHFEGKVKMNLGFRSNEYDRMEGFFNNGHVGELKIPTECSMKGSRRQKHSTFLWRFCSFPLIRDQISHEHIKDYWRKNGWIKANLFNERRQIEFPRISNCVGCFFKKAETLMVMANMHPEKMKWFASQEEKGRGTWLDSGTKYQTFIDHSENWIPEMITEIGSCKSGECLD